MKKMNVENKRGFTLLGIVLLVIILIAGVILYGRVKSTNIIKEFKALMAGDEVKAVYIMRDGCKYCSLNENNIKSMVDEYGFKYYNINTNDLITSDFDELISLLGIEDPEKFGTPYLVLVGNGEIKASLDGLRPYDMLFDFLKNNNIIEQSSKLYLKYPTYEEYMKIINSNDPQIVVLAQSTCSYCLAEQPVLIEVAKQTGAKINYINLDYLFKNEDQYNDFMSSLNWFSENKNWGTPTTLIVKNGVVKNYLSGYRSIDDIKEFYKDNGVIE